MKNRFQLQQMLDGVRATLKQENEKLSAMYADSTTTVETREAQKNLVNDLLERESGISEQIKALDKEAEKKLQAKAMPTNEKDRVIEAKAELIRNVMTGKNVSKEIYNALGDGASLGNGDKILPKTMTTELLHEPLATNPLRNISTFTNITNLEIPKITFSLDDDDFLSGDNETAKELKADASNIVFSRHKFKVFCDITETVLNGTKTNLVQVVQSGLASGLAKKEKVVAFATDSATDMSFYYKNETNPNNSSQKDYVIKKVEGADTFNAIISALADLEDDYAANATVVMRKVDYFNIIRSLAGNNTAIYAAQPEQILGAKVEFCDLATIPVVGDFRYSHYNYDLDMLYDRDKNVKTGIESFVLTAWIDHKIKMKSAFRLAIVTP